jgi:undecaprenyl-diphosphatase
MRRSIAGILFLLSLGISYLLDQPLALLLAGLSHEVLTGFFLIITEFWLVILVLYVLPLALLIHRKKFAFLPFLASSLLIGSLFSFLLKAALQRHRPYETLSFFPVVYEISPAFPSGHATIAFAALPFLFLLFKKERWYFFSFAVLVALSRMYLGVHYLSDVVFGAGLGFAIGYFLLHIKECRKNDFEKEWNRQCTHIFTGTLIVLLMATGYLKPLYLVPIIIIGFGISLLAKKTNHAVLSWFLDRMDRPSNLPGAGALTFFIGVTITLLIFPAPASLIGVLIFTFGDALSTLWGKKHGKTKHPLNPHKTIEGTVAGVVVGFLVAVPFFPWYAALGAAVIAMIVESLPFIDDNLTVPVAAAGVLLALSMI